MCRRARNAAVLMEAVARASRRERTASACTRAHEVPSPRARNVEVAQTVKLHSNAVYGPPDYRLKIGMKQ